MKYALLLVLLVVVLAGCSPLKRATIPDSVSPDAWTMVNAFSHRRTFEVNESPDHIHTRSDALYG